MPAAYRDSVAYITSGNSITVDPSTLTYQADDVLVLVAWGYTSLGAPSGSDLTWTERLSDTQAGPFSNTDICKVWTAVADASITSFTVANGATDQIGAVLVSVSGADTTTPVDAAAIDSNIFSVVANPTAPSVSPTGSDSLLICSVGVWPQSGGTSSFTPPSGMTEREDFESWDSYTVATLGLSASGATGTKAFAESPALGDDSAWIAASIAIKSAGGTNATVTPGVIAVVGAVPAATLSAGSTLAPAAVTAVAALPAASASAVTAVTPATIAAVSALPASTQQTGSTVGPSVVAVVAALPALTVAADQPKTFYLKDALAGTSAHLSLQDGGTAPTTARITTGWVVGNSAVLPYARMDSQTERASTANGDIAQPDGSPDNTLGDSFRSESALSGSFSSGDWSISIPVQGDTRATSTHDGRLNVRVWRSVNQDGSSATEVTTSTQVTSAYTDLANSASQTLTLTWAAPGFSLSTEYLFVQVAHEITGAGNNINSDTHLVVGSASTVVTTGFSTGTAATATPAVIATTAALPTSTLSAGSLVTAAAVSATAALPLASTAGVTNVTLAVLPAVAAAPAATPAASSTPTPAVIPTIAALPVASIATGATATPAVVPLLATLPAATATATGGAAPAVIATTVAIPALAVEQDWTTDPATTATVVALPAATPNTGSGATPTPAAIATVASLPAATPSAASAAAPAVIPTVAALPAATASAGSTATPAAIPAPVALPTTTVSAGATQTPAVLPAVASLPPATVADQGDATATPAAVPAAAALPAPTPTTGSTVIPAVVPTSAALPAASTATGATATPAAIPAVAALPLATVDAAGNASRQPATIAASAALPPVTPGTGSTATPGTIASVVSLPPATAAVAGSGTPATLAVTVAFPAASTATGADATVTPSVMAVSSAVNTPTISAASVVTPATLAVLVSLPGATIVALGNATWVTFEGGGASSSLDEGAGSAVSVWEGS